MNCGCFFFFIERDEFENVASLTTKRLQSGLVLLFLRLAFIFASQNAQQIMLAHNLLCLLFIISWKINHMIMKYFHVLLLLVFTVTEMHYFTKNVFQLLLICILVGDICWQASAGDGNRKGVLGH